MDRKVLTINGKFDANEILPEIGCVEKRFYGGFNPKVIQEYLIDRQARTGERLMEWMVIKDDTIAFWFEPNTVTMEKIMVSQDWEVAFENAQVAPWQIFFLGSQNRISIPRGERFSVIRPIPMMSEIIRVGDPCELVDVQSLDVSGYTEVVAIKRVKLKDLTGEDYKLLSKAWRKANLIHIDKVVTETYGISVNPDTVVALITMDARTPVKLKNKEEKQGGVWTKIFAKVGREAGK